MKPRDRAILVLLVAIWAACFAASTRWVLIRGSYTPVHVWADDSERVLVVTGLRGTRLAEPTPLHIGDRVLRVGTEDMRNASPFDFFRAFAAAGRRGDPVPVELERDGEAQRIQVPPAPGTIVLPRLAGSFAFMACGVLLFVRAPRSRAARGFLLAFTAVAVYFSATFFGTHPATRLSAVVHVLSLSLLAPLSLRAFQLFPAGAPPRSAWARFAPWIFAILGPLHATRFGVGLPATIGVPVVGTATVTFFVFLMRQVTLSYRSADAIGRRQLRWLLFGIYCATTLPLVGAILAAFDQGFTTVFVVTQFAIAFIPLSLVVAAARYNWLDVDRLISTAATYNLLIFTALGCAFVLVPRFADALSEPFGLDPSLGRLVLAVAVGLVFVPFGELIRPRLERILFAERHAIDRGMAKLLEELSGYEDAKTLTQGLASGLVRLLHPDSCVLYGRDGLGGLAPLYVDGRAIPSGLGDVGPLLETIDAEGGLLLLEESRRHEVAGLSDFQRAVLETLHAEVVMPIRSRGLLFALLCLGPKRSGDVYTTSDASLLTALGDKVSSQLARFEQDEIIRRSRDMQEALRQYVPGAVAEEIEAGHSLESAEHSVTVLFVDIRGYTAFSQSRDAKEIFRAVSLYTEVVTRIVREHGGSVVEFNGDGMMAVFGAPKELADKERAAVESGCAIFESVRGLLTGDAEGGSLVVGVGIASGAAYVGNIRSADRFIWSAIGNTTNLAARLQAMTRDLEVAIVIDAATYRGAGSACRDFEVHRSVVIRGRRSPEEVYALPMEDAGRAAG